MQYFLIIFLLVSRWREVQPSCIHLLRGILDKNPTRRFDAEKILSHKWFKDVFGEKPAGPIEISPALKKNLTAYVNATKLQKAVLTYMASQLSNKEIEPLRKLFISVDTSGDGIIETAEIEKALKGHPNEKVLVQLALELDSNKNKRIDYNEFLAAALGEETIMKKERLMEAFCLFDKVL